MTTKLRTGRAIHRRGATAFELALVLPPLLVLLLGIFEFSRLLMVQNLAENACREGARFAVVHTYDKTKADVQAQVKTMLAGQDANIQSFSIQVTQVDPATGNTIGVWNNTPFGKAISVQITGNYRPAVPNLLYMPTTIPLNVSSVMLSEAN